MTVRYQAHRVCVIVRSYPETSFWLIACATLAAGMEENTYILIPLLATQLVLVSHVFRRMWSPPIVLSVKPDSQVILLPAQPKAPDIERHRHARHR